MLYLFLQLFANKSRSVDYLDHVALRAPNILALMGPHQLLNLSMSLELLPLSYQILYLLGKNLIGILSMEK